MQPKNKAIEQIKEHEFFKDNLENLDIFVKYIIGRVDIKNYGNKDNNLIILECSDKKASIESPNWFKTKEGSGWVIESKKGILDLKIKCINDGILKIYIRGTEYFNRYGQKIIVDVIFTKLIVNDTVIFDTETKYMTLTKYFAYEMSKVKNGEIIDIHIEWEPS